MFTNLIKIPEQAKRVEGRSRRIESRILSPLRLGRAFFVKLFAFDNIINYISVEIVMSFALILVIET